MKKTIGCIVIFLLLVSLLTGCCFSHEWMEATCIAPQRCKLCGKTKGDRLPHQQGEWQITKKATATEEGLKQAFCTVCGNVAAEESYVRTKEEAVEEAQLEAFEAAKRELKSKLKDPSSLVINDAYFYYGEYDEETMTMSYAALKLDYNAKNGFGGSVRDTYVYFIKDVTELTADQIWYIMQN